MIIKHKIKQLKFIVKLIYLIIIINFITGCFSIIVWYLTPGHSFDESNKTVQLDYSKTQSWFSLPEVEDDADIILIDSEKDQKKSQKADVFFIHPTTYASSDSWNQNLESDNGIYNQIRWQISQASIFNECCKIYSPRYRQATIASFFNKDNGLKARSFAFNDVLASFDEYIKKYNKKRPIIIAGHSQGAELGLRLLFERFHNKKLRHQLIAAYLPGKNIPLNDVLEVLPDIPPCKTNSQLSCLNTWSTYNKKFKLKDEYRKADYIYLNKWIKTVDKKLMCTNPISWEINNQLVGRNNNQGSYLPMDDDKIVKKNKFVGAQCINGFLIVDVNEDELDFLPFGEGNYHQYDFSFYYVDIRKNALHRSKEWYLKK